MRTIVAGSRTITEYCQVVQAIEAAPWQVTVILSGTAKGVDSLGERYAREKGLVLERYFPNWARFGSSAGFIRNEEMAGLADALVAIWDGRSKGTANMINLARIYKLRIHVV